MNRLKELRLEKKETQADIAEILGVTRGAYTNIENGRRSPDLDSIATLANHYAVSVDYILGRTNNRKGISMFTMFDEERLEYAEDYRKLSACDRLAWLRDKGRETSEAIVPGEYDRLLVEEKTAVPKDDGLSPDERGLLDLYRSVNLDGKKYIVKQAKFAAGEDDYRLTPAPTTKTGA